MLRVRVMVKNRFPVLVRVSVRVSVMVRLVSF